MNSTPESDQPAEQTESSEPDDLQRIIDQGPLPGVPTPEEDEAQAAAEKKARRPGSGLDDGLDEISGFGQRGS